MHEEVYTDQEETEEVQEKESNLFQKKGTSSSQWTGAMQRSLLTSCFRPGKRCLQTKSMGPMTQCWVRWSSVCRWRRSTQLRGASKNVFWVRWMHLARGRLWNWFSWGNQTRNQRRGSKTLRWHRWCRSGTRLVWWCVRKRSKSQRLGKDVTWEESTGVLVTNLSQKKLGMTGGKSSHVEPWQRDSTNNVYGKLGHQDSFRRGEAEAYCKKLWRVMTYTDGWSRPSYVKMSGLEGKAMFECVESSSTFNRCLRQGSVDAPRLWQMMAAQLLASVEAVVSVDPCPDDVERLRMCICRQ